MAVIIAKVWVIWDDYGYLKLKGKNAMLQIKRDLNYSEKLSLKLQLISLNKMDNYEAYIKWLK